MSDDPFEPITLPGGRVIPESALSEAFVASGGPGGQNVNKVASRVQLSVRVDELPLSPEQLARVREQLHTRISNDGGVLTVAASKSRHQLANRRLARERLAELIAAALVVRPPRRRKQVPRGAIERRLEHKRRTSEKKKQRRWRPD